MARENDRSFETNLISNYLNDRKIKMEVNHIKLQPPRAIASKGLPLQSETIPI